MAELAQVDELTGLLEQERLGLETWTRAFTQQIHRRDEKIADKLRRYAKSVLLFLGPITDSDKGCYKRR